MDYKKVTFNLGERGDIEWSPRVMYFKSEKWHRIHLSGKEIHISDNGVGYLVYTYHRPHPRNYAIKFDAWLW